MDEGREVVAGKGEATRAARRDSMLRAARILAVLIFLLASLAALVGLLSHEAAGPGRAVNGWGRSVQLDGRGIYARDSISGAIQERAQDLVTLVFALPLLALGWALSPRAGAGARLLFAGALGYFLYCFGMMAVGTTYNALFLVYVALFALSLWAFVLALASVGTEELGPRPAGFPRRAAATLLFLIAGFLALNWIGAVVLPAQLGGREPAGLDAYSTLFVQAIDLAVLVPAAAVSAFWLLRRDSRGYLLGSALLVKGAAEGLAVTAMGFSLMRKGFAEGASATPMVLIFLALALGAVAIGAKAITSLWRVGRGRVSGA